MQFFKKVAAIKIRAIMKFPIIIRIILNLIWQFYLLSCIHTCLCFACKLQIYIAVIATKDHLPVIKLPEVYSSTYECFSPNMQDRIYDYTMLFYTDSFDW